MQGRHPDGRLTPATPRGRLTAATRILLTGVLGTMLVPPDSTMIAVSLPRLIADFHSRIRSAGWLVTGYLIAMASLQPVAGNLGDRLGRRPLLLGGLAWFAVASLGAGLAPCLPLLIAFASSRQSPARSSSPTASRCSASSHRRAGSADGSG